MSHEEFFKNEAKKFLKDWRTQIKTVESNGYISYHYDWKFYDVGSLFFYYELDDKDEQEIILARAQHYIAKMVGFSKWDDLIHASEPRQQLSELLLKRFKTAENVKDWEETLMFTGVAQYGDEAVLDYAMQYFELGDRKEIVNLPVEKVILLTGKLKTAEINNFSDKNNPEGTLRKDSYVLCTHCNKAFNFNQSKVIRDNVKHLSTVVCKNYPKCRGTYLDFKVLSPTIMFGNIRQAALEKGISALKTNFTMDTKVHCLHCGKEYLYKEATAVQSPDEDEPLVYCKHYLECDGSLIDMMSV